MMMKNGAIVCNIGHFNYKIQIMWLGDNCMIKTNIKPYANKFTLSNNKNVILLAGNRLVLPVMELLLN